MSWALVTLADVATINPRIPKEKKLPDDVAFLPMAAVSEQGEVLNPELRPLAEVRKGFTYFERGDVLLAKITPCFENGKAAFLEGLETEVGFGSTEFHVVRPNADTLDGKFLFYLLWNAKFRHQGERNMTGSAGQRRVPTSYLERYTFALPPLETQKHIARVLEQADQLRKQAQQMESELNQLAQSLFLEMFGDPVRNPKGWPLERLGAHLESIDSGWSPTCDDVSASEGEWGVLKLGAVTSCTYRETENKKLPSDLSPRPKIEVKEGDLLFSRKNTYNLVAAAAYVRQTKGRIMLSDLIFRLMPKASLEPIYLWGLLTNPTFRTEVQLLAGGAAGSMPNISKSKLAEKQFPLASHEAQIRYVKAMRQLWRQMDALSENAQQLDDVFRSLLSRAFKGELTAPGSKAS